MVSSQNSFLQRYQKIVSHKNSILCIGLDPVLPSQRSKYTMKDDDRLDFMRTMIKDVAPHTSVIKMNRQFLIGLTADEIRSLNILIHQNEMLSIIDHKLILLMNQQFSGLKKKDLMLLHFLHLEPILKKLLCLLIKRI